MIVVTQSALKHHISREQIMDVLQSVLGEIFDEGFDSDGHYLVMIVGFDSRANLLEVKAEVIQTSPVSGYIRVFHASKATQKYERLFNQRKGK
jgi:hypothetical protein